MSQNYMEIVRQAQQLSPEERLQLATAMYASLDDEDSESDEASQTEFDAELDRRLELIEKGEAGSHSFEEIQQWFADKIHTRKTGHA